MKCPVCESKGMESRVYPGTSMMTAMYSQPYYDEKGTYHDHDSNTLTTDYRCSLGHRWIEDVRHKCPNCDYNKDSSTVEIINDKETQHGKPF